MEKTYLDELKPFLNSYLPFGDGAKGKSRFERNKVLDLVPRPEDVNVIGTKWIFKNKCDKTGNVARNKVYVKQPKGFIDHNSPDHVYKLKKALWIETSSKSLSEFEMSLIGELTYFIGFLVKQMKDSIFVSQSKYAKSKVKKFCLDYTIHKRTPAAAHLKLSKDENGVDVDQRLYKSMIGSLLYLTTSRPDITFFVDVSSMYQETLKAS
ncbi:uncharacterized protein LOC131650407 [Vicia villosa]|uniref:uncharacterized protein LOC131650407 n=1 Tax=Vicia villosa TaxID=3911 RepID=UPI00273BFD7A|nr:uncharacterized protein LOC131650407 [Vicia villosa]